MSPVPRKTLTVSWPLQSSDRFSPQAKRKALRGRQAKTAVSITTSNAKSSIPTTADGSSNQHPRRNRRPVERYAGYGVKIRQLPPESTEEELSDSSNDKSKGKGRARKPVLKTASMAHELHADTTTQNDDQSEAKAKGKCRAKAKAPLMPLLALPPPVAPSIEKREEASLGEATGQQQLNNDQRDETQHIPEDELE